MSQQLPNPETVQDSVGKLERFVAYVVEVLRGNNLTRKLLLLDVLIFLIFNPVSFNKILELFSVNSPPNRYAVYFWISVGAVFVTAVIAAWRTLPRQKPRRDLAERTAIKGLLPYDTSDAALFARLQRQNDLTECSQAIAAREFRFGVLCGESGNGKTSFLQAGLRPRLPENGHRCVYVKCTELDPVEAIRQALLEQLEPDSNKLPATLPEMLKAVARLDASPLVLILDQFEQFFVHRPRKKDRVPFLMAMEAWFKQETSLPVKILISLRSDFLDRLIELQKLMGYSLGPHQNFRLDKFLPPQAADIFRVIAEQEKLECDYSFVRKLAAEELAGISDGLVSPVDIQVLAWMIAAQKLEEERAFNEKTFRRLGGIEGLLERFLNRALDARETDARRQAVVKVLLGLTDLDRNTRAGVLTIAELEERLKSQLPPVEIGEAVEWMSRGDVRLIVPVKRKVGEKEVNGYELAHERLIPALRRIAAKQLSEATRGEQMLDRRTNEWLGSGRQSRYLFSWRELRLINKHQKLITWGKDRQAKEALLRASRRRFRLLYSAGALVTVLAVMGWITWRSNAWQIWLIKRDLRTYGSTLNDNAALADIAQAFVYAGDSQQAFKVLDRISDPARKRDASRAIVESYGALGDKGRAKTLLAEAVKTAALIRDNSERARELRAITASYAKLAVTMSDIQLLAEAAKTAGQIPDQAVKALSLSAIAHAYAELKQTENARVIMIEAIKTAGLIPKELEELGTIAAIVESCAKLAVILNDSDLLAEGAKTANLILNDSEKVSALSAIAQSYDKLDDKKNSRLVLAEALRVARLPDSSYDKVNALAEIAVSYARLGDKETAMALLADAVKTMGLITDTTDRVNLLRSVALSSANTGLATNDPALLAQAVKTARLAFDNPYFMGITLSAIAESYAKLGLKMKDRTLLAEAIKTAELLKGGGAIQSLPVIAKSYAELGVAMKDSTLLAEAVDVTTRLGDAYTKPSALTAIAEAYAKLERKEKASALLAEAVKATGAIRSEPDKAVALSLIAASYTRLAESFNDRDLYEKTFGFIDALGSDDGRDKVLKSILSTRLAAGDLPKLRALISRLSEVRNAQALARILKAVSHPDLITKERESQDKIESDRLLDDSAFR